MFIKEFLCIFFILLNDFWVFGLSDSFYNTGFDFTFFAEAFDKTNDGASVFAFRACDEHRGPPCPIRHIIRHITMSRKKCRKIKDLKI